MSTIKRVIYSVTECKSHSQKDTIKLRAFQIKNLVNKSLGKPTRSWPHSSVQVKQRFGKIQYQYVIPKNTDFNIFLNPYFHEYDITSFVAAKLTPQDIFVDLGAHAGLYTIIASKKAPNGKVYSFEPNPINLQYLKENIMLNDLPNVTVVPKAVSNMVGETELTFNLNQTGSCSATHRIKDEQCITVATTTIDEELQNYQYKIKVIKIDTEGFDLQCLQGAEKTLKKTKYVIIERNDNEVKDYLRKKGFVVKVLKPSNYLLAINPTF